MMKKTVNIFDAVTGEFLGIYYAQESPLEPGVFICPECSTDDPLPSLADGEKAFYVDGAWVVRAAKPKPEAIPPTEAELFLRAKADALAYLNSTDWYFARLAETSAPVPGEVLMKRAAARVLLN